MRAKARLLVCAAVIAAAVAGAAREAAAQDTTDVERRARRARQGAGIQVGMWGVTGLPEPANHTFSTWPLFGGYFQKGLDQHLALETSVGVWRREQRPTGATGDLVRAYVIPQLTQLKLYPATTPEQNLEPFIAGGIGVTIGVDNREAVGGGILGGGGSGTQLGAGIGFRGTGGIEYRLGRVFGLAAYVGYQYVYFLEDMAGAQSYKGLVAGGGITYRFQY